MAKKKAPEPAGRWRTYRLGTGVRVRYEPAAETKDVVATAVKSKTPRKPKTS